MKSHDCHVFMQNLVLPAFRGIVDDKVIEPLVEVSRYFKQLCSKTLTVDVLDQMETRITILYASYVVYLFQHSLILWSTWLSIWQLKLDWQGLCNIVRCIEVKGNTSP